jgi:hypothetical protein
MPNTILALSGCALFVPRRLDLSGLGKRLMHIGELFFRPVLQKIGGQTEWGPKRLTEMCRISETKLNNAILSSDYCVSLKGSR